MQSGSVSSLRSEIETLRRVAGFFVDKDLETRILAMVGESGGPLAPSNRTKGDSQPEAAPTVAILLSKMSEQFPQTRSAWATVLRAAAAVLVRVHKSSSNSSRSISASLRILLKSPGPSVSLA